jgi:hypothetical protein
MTTGWVEAGSSLSDTKSKAPPGGGTGRGRDRPGRRCDLPDNPSRWVVCYSTT